MNIETTDVTKSYGSVTALDGLSLSVPTGSTFGLLGTNGAGKTTLFRLLIGHDRPDSGSVRIGGTTVSTAGARVRERVGYLPERVGFPPELTAREVLEVTARVRSRPGSEGRVGSVLDRVGLGDDADRPVEGFSNGMRRRLGLATALLPDPDVLLLDEPTAGLDPLGVLSFHRIVEEVTDRTDATVLVCSHALAEVERLCDRVAILHDGRVLASGGLAAVAGSEGTRRVRVACADPARRERVLDRCRPFGEPRVRGETVAVDVACEDARDLLCALDEAVGLDRVELRTPGLEEAFESLVGGRATGRSDAPEPGGRQMGDAATSGESTAAPGADPVAGPEENAPGAAGSTARTEGGSR